MSDRSRSRSAPREQTPASKTFISQDGVRLSNLEVAQAMVLGVAAEDINCAEHPQTGEGPAGLDEVVQEQSSAEQQSFTICVRLMSGELVDKKSLTAQNTVSQLLAGIPRPSNVLHKAFFGGTLLLHKWTLQRADLYDGATVNIVRIDIFEHLREHGRINFAGRLREHGLAWIVDPLGNPICIVDGNAPFFEERPCLMVCARGIVADVLGTGEIIPTALREDALVRELSEYGIFIDFGDAYGGPFVGLRGAGVGRNRRTRQRALALSLFVTACVLRIQDDVRAHSLDVVEFVDLATRELIGP